MYRHAEAERGGGDEGPGRKKSRFKALKTRLFGRLKRKDTDTGQIKQSQSASDVTAPENTRGSYDSEEDLLYPKGTLNSRALSHDSIFLADQAQCSSEPPRVLSQENVHSKIKALQMKLQQQNFHLGPPPLLIPSKRYEDSGATSEDDGLPHSPPEISFHDGGRHTSSYKRNHSSLSLAGTGSEEEQVSSQPPSRPLSPQYYPSYRDHSPTPTDTSPLPPAADFDTPAQFTSNLDTSAARHRLSVKPRHQRPSNKAKKMPSSAFRTRSESMHDLVQALSEGEEEAAEGAGPSEEKSRFRSHSTHIVTIDRERLALLGLHVDSDHSTSPDPQEERCLLTPEPEDTLAPRSSSQDLLEGEMSVDGDLEEQTVSDPERQITVNPLYLQPMPEELQPEDLKPEESTTLPEPKTPEESVDQEEGQEELVDLTEPDAQLENSERTLGNLSPVSAPTLRSETYEENEQSVDGPVDEHSPKLKTETENVPSREETRNLVSDANTQASNQGDSKLQPVAAPRLRKLTSQGSFTAPLRRRAESSASESEREISAQQPQVVLRAKATPGGQEREMSVDGEIRSRPNSGSFSISSARRRSKIVDSGEWNGTNTDEFRRPVESPLVKTLVNKGTPDQTRDQPESPQKQQSVLDRLYRDQAEEKAKESPQKHSFAPEKRPSLKRRELVPNGSVSRTVEEEEKKKTDVLVGGEAKAPECQSRQTETAEEKRNAFGVTLRSTSLSLKYRSEALLQSEAKQKRHSLEASYMRAISEDLPGPHAGRGTAGSTVRAETTNNKAFSLGRQPSMSVDFGHPVSVPTGSSTEDLKCKEPPVMARLRDRGFRSSLGSAEGLSVEPSWRNQSQPPPQPQHQPSGPAQPASETTTTTTTPESLLLQMKLRSIHKTASEPTPPKVVAKASTLPAAPKPTARGAPERPTSWVTDKTAGERRWDWANMADEKKASLGSSRMNDAAPCGDHLTNNNSKPAQGSSASSGSQMSSSPPSLQQSARGQPSWMELAKRKSLAWNDKSLE